jgi:adhesin transport system membrane fusion protein
MMAELNEKSFERIGQATQAGARLSDPIFGRLTRRLTSGRPDESIDWAADADWAQLQQEPLRARWLLRIAALVVVLLIAWAAVAEIDEVTRGEARVVPSSQVQIIQSVDGGWWKRSWRVKARWWNPGSCCCAWTRPALPPIWGRVAPISWLCA